MQSKNGCSESRRYLAFQKEHIMIKITLKTATAEVGEHDAVIVRGLDAAVICNETPDTARNL